MSSILLIPIAPLSRTKSRLRDCFSKELLKDLTIAMFKDLANKVVNVDCFDRKVVYCNSGEILDLAEEYGLVGIKEDLTVPRKSFDEVIGDLNSIAIEEFNATSFGRYFYFWKKTSRYFAYPFFRSKCSFFCRVTKRRSRKKLEILDLWFFSGWVWYRY